MTRYYRIPPAAVECEWDGETLYRDAAGSKLTRQFLIRDGQVTRFAKVIGNHPEDAAIRAAWEAYCDQREKEALCSCDVCGGPMEDETPPPGRFWFLPARVPCDDCDGTGKHNAGDHQYAGAHPSKCFTCDGTGYRNPHGIAQDEIVPEDDPRLALEPGEVILVELDVHEYLRRAATYAGIRAISASGRQDYRRE